MPASSSPSSSTTANQDQSHQITKMKRRLYFGYGSNLWREQMALRCPKSEFLGIARLRGYRWMINERGYANVAEVLPGLEHQDAKITDGATTRGDIRSSKLESKDVNASEPTQDSSSADTEKDAEKDEDSYTHQVEPSFNNDDDDDDHENSVWGAVYSLTSSDEGGLDINEGVPYAYEKRDVPGVEFWSVDISSGAKYHHLHEDKHKHKHNGVRDRKPEIVDMLVYIDFKRNDGEGCTPREEYIHRMNMGIIDALEAGVPRGYVDKVLRRWIPEEEEHSLDDGEGGNKGEKKNKKATKKSKARELALSQARAFKDESGVIPSSGDDN